MAPIRPTNRRRLWWQFLGGLVYLTAAAGALALATGHHFWPVFAGVLGGALCCSGLALTWLTLWAVRKDSRLGQFGIGSLLFLMLFAAFYLGLVRWIMDTIEKNAGQRVGSSGLLAAVAEDAGQRLGGPGLFAAVAAACLLAVILAIPILLRMSESLLWLAVWMVRRPAIRRMLAKRRTK